MENCPRPLSDATYLGRAGKSFRHNLNIVPSTRVQRLLNSFMSFRPFGGRKSAVVAGAMVQSALLPAQHRHTSPGGLLDRPYRRSSCAGVTAGGHPFLGAPRAQAPCRSRSSAGLNKVPRLGKLHLANLKQPTRHPKRWVAPAPTQSVGWPRARPAPTGPTGAQDSMSKNNIGSPPVGSGLLCGLQRQRHRRSDRRVHPRPKRDGAGRSPFLAMTTFRSLPRERRTSSPVRSSRIPEPTGFQPVVVQFLNPWGA